MGEFELIARHFKRPARRARVGVGDDCAVILPRAGHAWAISTDMLVVGQHFFEDVDPGTLGHKSLAVNLSDLAACAAEPVAFTLALALPEANDTWLSAFAEGLFALADAHGCELVGGDTSRGPLSICITVFGEIAPPGQALLRSGAQAGDDLYVSGHLGDARLALLALQGKMPLRSDALAWARQRLESPQPRVALGLRLRGLASAAIDLSDGLTGDLGHLMQSSGVGASVMTDALLQTMSTRQAFGDLGLTDTQWTELALVGGDDYELLFTASPRQREAILQAAKACQTPVQRIGQISADPGMRLIDASGNAVIPILASFDHFASV